MIDSHLNVQAPADAIRGARCALKEMEQEFIMLRFKFGSPGGKFKNEIKDVPGVGLLTVHSTRDTMFMNNVRHEMKRLHNLLNSDESFITSKRLLRMRQRFNGMALNNQNASRSKSTSAWNIKSAKFIAGKFLSAIFCKHLSRDFYIS